MKVEVNWSLITRAKKSLCFTHVLVDMWSIGTSGDWPNINRIYSFNQTAIFYRHGSDSYVGNLNLTVLHIVIWENYVNRDQPGCRLALERIAAGNLKRPSLPVITQWEKTAWDSIDPAIITK